MTHYAIATSRETIEHVGKKKICRNCVGEAYLSTEIGHSGTRRICSYCGARAKTITLSELADRVALAFDSHYVRTSNQPNFMQSLMISDSESSYYWTRDGDRTQDAIMYAAEISERAAIDVQRILEDRFDDFDLAAIGEETEFSENAHYEERSATDSAWRDAWDDFENRLKSETRFLSRTALSHLEGVFEGLEHLRTTDGRSVLVGAGPGTGLSVLHRARVFQAEERLREAMARPDRNLGPPPARLATAGRMNARGISVFYGAKEAKAAVAEVRPPVGSKVLLARFEITRQLLVLDLTALEEVRSAGSIFDPTHIGRLEREMFLRSLGTRLARPVMPDDEAFDYLATQAIADFLSATAEPSLDGIIYRSVQATGTPLNVVLFHKASRVERISLPEGTEIEASLGYADEDGPYEDYTVTESVPPGAEPPPREAQEFGDFDSLTAFPWEPRDPDSRDISLRVLLDSIHVHEIDGVAFSSTEHAVRRSRWEKREADF